MQLIVLALLIPCSLFGGIVLALIALVRAQRAEAGLRALQQELARAGRETRRLATRMEALESTQPAPADAHVTDPGEASVVIPAEAPAVTPAVTPIAAKDDPPVTPPTESVPEATSIPESSEAVPALAGARDDLPARTPPTAPTPAEASTKPGVDWERWIGIRGAAVFGALALGLAGLLFFQYSIEHGLISPAMRVLLGTAAGAGCVTGAFALRRRGYAFTADGVAGAGVVILYAAFWAAHMLYSLIPLLAAGVLMALVTAGCCVMATRYRSQLIAIAGLVGGFATPLLLSSGSDRPIGLFGYVLLLDLGLLFVARKGRWPALGLLSLIGTGLMEVLWIGGRMGPDRLFLGMLFLAGFGALFAFAGRLNDDRGDRGAWLWTRLSAVGMPFLFALYFAARVDLGPRLYPLGIFMALLVAGAAWMARELDRPRFALGAAGACVAVVGVWLASHRLTPALAWETVAVMLGLALLFHVFCEWRRTEASAGPAPATAAALLSAVGFFALLLLLSVGGSAPVWPLVAGWTGLVALAYRQAGLSGLAVLQPVAAVGLAVGLTSLHLHTRSPLVSPTVFLTLLVATALGLFLVARVRRDDLRRHAMHAAAAFAAVVLAGLPTGFIRVLSPLEALGVAALLGTVVAAAAAWLRRGAWYAVAVASTLFAQVAWVAFRPGLLQDTSLTLTAFGILLATVCGLTVWPFVLQDRFRAQPAAWRAAALAGPLALIPLIRLYDAAWGDAAIGLLPTLLGAMAMGGAWAAYRTLVPGERASGVALVWFSAAAACLFAVAIPLQFEHEWVTIGWALQGLALAAVWKRLDHPGLKYLAIFLLGAATLRLVVNPTLFFYHPRSGVPILNWLLYTYLIPAGALLGSAALLRPLEVARARTWERGLYASGKAGGALAAGVGAIVVIFAWINLAIADVFSTGTRLAFDLGGDPAQRLTVSIAWAVYAVVLLVLGMARNAQGLRWLSLGFLIVTIGKVFLYDLGSLEDLYRVASLVGLATSLILVSLLYQRFVFRQRSPAGTPPN